MVEKNNIDYTLRGLRGFLLEIESSFKVEIVVLVAENLYWIKENRLFEEIKEDSGVPIGNLSGIVV